MCLPRNVDALEMKLKSKTLEYLKKTSIIEFNFEFDITDVFLALLLNVRVVHVPHCSIRDGLNSIFMRIFSKRF